MKYYNYENFLFKSHTLISHLYVCIVQYARGLLLKNTIFAEFPSEKLWQDRILQPTQVELRRNQRRSLWRDTEPTWRKFQFLQLNREASDAQLKTSKNGHKTVGLLSFGPCWPDLCLQFPSAASFLRWKSCFDNPYRHRTVGKQNQYFNSQAISAFCIHFLHRFPTATESPQ